MKTKLKIFGLVLLALVFITNLGANWYASTSGEQTSDAAVATAKCYITSILIITNGSDNAKVVLYDNASAASGTVILEMTVVGVDNYGGRNYQYPVKCTNGIYADVTGTGASYIVEYILH